MEYINKVELLGVVNKFAISDTDFYNFSICILNTYKMEEEAIVETTWLNVKANGKNVNGVITKGKFAHVIGRIKTSKYCSSDGKEHYSYYILANKVKIY